MYTRIDRGTQIVNEKSVKMDSAILDCL
jgi:hypothetical protein